MAAIDPSRSFDQSSATLESTPLNRQTAIVLLSTLLFSAIAGCSQNEPDASEGAFMIIMLPDTQNAVDFMQQRAAGFAIDSSEIYLEQMRYIAGRGVSNGGNVVFVASVGDVWQHVSSDNDPAHDARGVSALIDVEAGFQRFVNHEGAVSFEIPKAVEGYQLISDAGIPFGVPPGNHDYDAWWAVALPGERRDPQRPQSHVGGLNNFRTAFGSDTAFFRDKDWYVSGFEGGGSSAQVFDAGGYRFLHLAFEMHAGDDVIAWARGVIDDYAGLPTIISTHDYLNSRGERLPGPSMDLALVDPEHNNSAEEIWRDFISQTDQIFMVLSGHQPGQALRIDTNDFGREVYQILADFQLRGQAGLDAGEALGQGIGDGWHREMTFHLQDENPRVGVRTYSTHYDAYASDLGTYADWYKSREQPEMTNEQFVSADEYTINLKDWRARFGAPVLQ